MRPTVLGLGALCAVLAASSPARAQLQNKVIDTNALIVQPADTATNIFSATAKYVNRAVASTIDSDGFVKTINNLLGRRSDPKRTTQDNGLPLPGSYQSTQYKNSFIPAMPRTQQFGQSVPVVK